VIPIAIAEGVKRVRKLFAGRSQQAALLFGCDDFGGTLYEENVHAEAGYINITTLPETIRLIHEAGFDAVQRTTRYEKLKTYPKTMSEKDIQAAVGLQTSFRKNKPVNQTTTSDTSTIREKIPTSI
jgi:hypothetical protein